MLLAERLQLAFSKREALKIPIGSEFHSSPYGLIVFSAEFEVALRMIAYGAYFGSLLSYHDVSTVGALPYAVAIA